MRFLVYDKQSLRDLGGSRDPKPIKTPNNLHLLLHFKLMGQSREARGVKVLVRVGMS